MDSVCMKRCGVLLLTALAGVAAFAVDKYYLKATETSSSYGGFTDPSKWGKGGTSGEAAEAFDPTAEYIFKASQLRIRVRGDSSKTFQGGCLVVGEGGNHASLYLDTTYSPNVVTFGNEGLRIVRGCIYCIGSEGSVYLTDGPISVKMSSNSGRYAGISYNYDNQTLKHAGTLAVASGDVLTVASVNGFCGALRKYCTFEVSGSCSGVLGTIEVSSPSTKDDDTVMETHDTTFGLGTTTIPGTVEIGRNCRLKTISGTNVLEIANLSFAANTWLDVPYDSEHFSFGTVRVTGTFMVADKVTITAPATASRMAKAAVLTVPKSSGVTEANFVLADSNNDPYRTLTVEEEGDDVVVYITYANIPVYQAYSNCTLGTSEWWSDGLPSRAGVNYVLDLGHVTNSGASSVVLKMPADVTSYEFPGDSLTLGNNCSFSWSREASTAPVFDCKLLRLLNGSLLSGGQKSPIKITGGIIDAVSGAVDVFAGNGRNVVLDSEITGSAELRLRGYASASSSPYAAYIFYGLNTNFLGTITVRQRLVTNDDSHIRNNYATAHNSLTITNALSLGGNLASPTPKALILAYYAPLIVSGNTTLAAESNRGIFIENTGRIYVGTSKSNPYTFRMETPLAIDGTLWKEGAGTLEMAGTMAFGSDGLASMPETDKNNFIVTGGVVRVCSAGALDGAAVLMSPGTSLELAVDLSNAELTAQGIRNVKTDTPFSLAGMSSLPISLKVDGVSPPASVFSFAVMTVSANAADSVRAMLPSFPSPFRRYAATPTETVDPESGNVTFGLRLVYQGTKIIVR